MLVSVSGVDSAVLEDRYFLHPAEKLWPAAVVGDTLTSGLGGIGVGE